MVFGYLYIYTYVLHPQEALTFPFPLDQVGDVELHRDVRLDPGGSVLSDVWSPNLHHREAGDGEGHPRPATELGPAL